MKAINLMGMKYTEDMINVLRRYDKHMKDSSIKIIEEDGSINVLDIYIARKEYLESLNNEEADIIDNFIEIGSFLSKRHPVINIIFAISVIALTCLMDIFIVKMLFSVLVAGILTIELRTLAGKRAYKKIMNLIHNN
jgi:hypothetical protein